ncbi:hypothetical protein TNCV_4793581 [Trichonephila clavipes]|nr:hypothetical protein TNCV_4793581 [Trichonephila clavipes]
MLSTARESQTMMPHCHAMERSTDTFVMDMSLLVHDDHHWTNRDIPHREHGPIRLDHQPTPVPGIPFVNSNDAHVGTPIIQANHRWDTLVFP